VVRSNAAPSSSHYRQPVVEVAGRDAAARAAASGHPLLLTRDGVQLAYSTTGSGRPLVKTANWLNHLEFDFESPVWRHVIRALSADHTLVRYDARGNGLSDWRVEELSFDRLVDDLETVVDALGLDRFPYLAISQGCAISIAYAVRHPERVSHLILHGGYPVGWRKRQTPDEIARPRGDADADPAGLGAREPGVPAGVHLALRAGRQRGADALVQRPAAHLHLARERGATEQRAVAHRRARAGAQVRTPTLVLHATYESAVPYVKRSLSRGPHPGRALRAAREPLSPDPRAGPVWPQYRDEILAFLDT
jgi:pimeloyl-ACP methyl ester carboxylesterase